MVNYRNLSISYTDPRQNDPVSSLLYVLTIASLVWIIELKSLPCKLEYVIAETENTIPQYPSNDI